MNDTTAAPLPTPTRPHSPSSATKRIRSVPAVDDACLAAAVLGDETAWSTIYHEFAGSILGYLRLHRTPDPDDVLGEVFLDAARGIHRFDGTEAGFRSWLFTIAHHRMVDHVRRSARRPTLDALDALTDGLAECSSASHGTTIDERVFERLDVERARALLERLAPEQRDVFLLVYVADMSLVEAARTLDKTIGAVKALHLRGLASLRRMTVQPATDR